jgi:hypothetical protein
MLRHITAELSLYLYHEFIKDYQERSQKLEELGVLE